MRTIVHVGTTTSGRRLALLEQRSYRFMGQGYRIVPVPANGEEHQISGQRALPCPSCNPATDAAGSRPGP